MASKKTSRQILIELGFDVQVEKLEKSFNGATKTINREINKMLKQAKVLQRAFDLIKIDPSKMIDEKGFEETFENLRENLKKLEEQYYITFTKINKYNIDYQRSIGGAAYESASITPNGIENVALSKSEAASDSRSIYYPLASGLDAVKLQTQRSTIISSALGGNKTEKELLKENIVDILKTNNDEISKFLTENVQNMDKYISDLRLKYNENGLVTKAWVDFQIAENKRLNLELERFTGKLADGTEFSAFARKDQTVDIDGQDIYTKSQEGIKKYNTLVNEQISLYKKLRSEKESSYYTDTLQNEIDKRESEKSVLEEIILDQEKLKKLKQKYSSAINQINQKQDISDQQNQEKKDLQEYNNILQKQISIHKELLSQKQNSKYTSILEDENKKLEEQKGTLKQNISNQEELKKLEEKYNTEISKIDAKNTYAQDKKNIQEYNSILQKQISIHKELSSAKEDNAYTQVLKQENSQLEDQKKTLEQNISNKEELNRLEKEYNAEIGKIDAKQSATEDADKINAAVKAKKELLKAETDLYKLRSQKADNDSIQEQSKYVDKLSDSLKKAESVQLSNGQAVSQSTAYRKEANKADEQAAETQRQLSTRYKETKVSLSNLADGIQKAAKNVLQYNLAWSAMNRVDDAISASIEKIRELDQEMTQIQLVTGETDEQVRETINSYADLAIQLGATTQEVSDGKLICRL